MLHGLLIAWMVMSVTSKAVQIGLNTGTTRTGCIRRVFSLGTKQLLQCTFSQYSPVGMYLSAGRFHCILREAVFPLEVFLFQYLHFLCYFFPKSLYLPVSKYQFINCVCFTIPMFLMFALVSQYQLCINVSLFNFWVPLHIHVAATM